jgi:hypothetical protein
VAASGHGDDSGEWVFSPEWLDTFECLHVRHQNVGDDHIAAPLAVASETGFSVSDPHILCGSDEHEARHLAESHVILDEQYSAAAHRHFRSAPSVTLIRRLGFGAGGVTSSKCQFERNASGPCFAHA